MIDCPALDTACLQGDCEGLDISEAGQGSKKPSKAWKSREPKTILVHEVPPWGLLSLGLTPEEAAAETVDHLRINSPALAIGLLWRLRQIAAAEGHSATQPHTAGDSANGVPATHIPTHVAPTDFTDFQPRAPGASGHSSGDSNL